MRLEITFFHRSFLVLPSGFVLFSFSGFSSTSVSGNSTRQTTWSFLICLESEVAESFVLTEHEPGHSPLALLFIWQVNLKKRERTLGDWTITSPLLKSFCNTSAWLISFPQCTRDWLKQQLTHSLIQGYFLLQSGATACGEWAIGAGEGGAWL